MSVAMLRRDADRPQNEGVDEDVKQDMADVEAAGLRVARRNAANARDLELIRGKLPNLRKAGLGPAELERLSHAAYVQGTISRMTKEFRPGYTPEGDKS